MTPSIQIETEEGYEAGATFIVGYEGDPSIPRGTRRVECIEDFYVRDETGKYIDLDMTQQQRNEIEHQLWEAWLDRSR